MGDALRQKHDEIKAKFADTAMADAPFEVMAAIHDLLPDADQDFMPVDDASEGGAYLGIGDRALLIIDAVSEFKHGCWIKAIPWSVVHIDVEYRDPWRGEAVEFVAQVNVAARDEDYQVTIDGKAESSALEWVGRLIGSVGGPGPDS